jgi:hypothetical protein
VQLPPAAKAARLHPKRTCHDDKADAEAILDLFIGGVARPE